MSCGRGNVIVKNEQRMHKNSELATPLHKWVCSGWLKFFGKIDTQYTQVIHENVLRFTAGPKNVFFSPDIIIITVPSSRLPLVLSDSSSFVIFWKCYSCFCYTFILITYYMFYCYYFCTARNRRVGRAIFRKRNNNTS